MTRHISSSASPVRRWLMKKERQDIKCSNSIVNSIGVRRQKTCVGGWGWRENVLLYSSSLRFENYKIKEWTAEVKSCRPPLQTSDQTNHLKVILAALFVFFLWMLSMSLGLSIPYSKKKTLQLNLPSSLAYGMPAVQLMELESWEMVYAETCGFVNKKSCFFLSTCRSEAPQQTTGAG